MILESDIEQRLVHGIEKLGGRRVSRFTRGSAVTAVPRTSFPRRRGEDDLLPSAWVVPWYAVRRGMQYRATGGTLWG